MVVCRFAVLSLSLLFLVSCPLPVKATDGLPAALQQCLNKNANNNPRTLTKLDCSADALGNEDIAALANMKRLKVLSLSGLQHLDPGLLARLGFVETLDLSDTDLNELPDFGPDSKIRDLNLAGTHLRNLHHLPKKLNRLVLDKSSSSCADIPPGTTVEEVTLSGKGLDLASCANVQGLKTLRVNGGTFSIPRQDISGFADTGLCRLTLTNTNVTYLDSDTPVPIQFLELRQNQGLQNMKSAVHRSRINGQWRRPH